MQRLRLRAWAQYLAQIAVFLGGFVITVSARAADPGAAPIAVVLHSESAELSFDSLTRALDAELPAPTVPADSPSSAEARGVLTVTYRPQTKELVVSYSDATRGTVTRIVPAPEREVAELAALVAGNLVRDQASEFLPSAVPVASAPQPSIPTSPSEIPPKDEPAPKPPLHRLGNATLFYPLATNMNEPELTTNFDFNLLYGHIGALDGLQIGMVSTITGTAQGLQISALTNVVGEQVRAGQISALFNRGRSVEGVQVALVNQADTSMHGAQLGALNLAGSLSQGLQLSGANIAGNFEGVQIGVVNVAKRVRGVQLGLINVADDVDGVPIGLISVSKRGGVHPVAWSSNTTYGNVGVKFATRYTYTMLGGAMHYDGANNLYGAGFTIGGSIPVHKQIAADIDLQALHLFSDGQCVQAGEPGRSYYPLPGFPASRAGAGTPNGGCLPEGTVVAEDGLSTVPPNQGGFTSASSRAFDQSLAKLRAMLRFDILPHLSLFVGTGVTGKVTYPVVNRDTDVQFRLLPEIFGGVQL
jgi:hypothetical protein